MPEITKDNLLDLIKNATSEYNGPVTHANNINVTATQDELFLTFLETVISGERVRTSVVGQFVLPISNAKSLATLIANSVAHIEKNGKEIIPNRRKPDPGDLITIWKD